jgi:hypothetical protein
MPDDLTNLDEALELSERRSEYIETLGGVAVVAGVCLEYIPKLALFLGTPSWENFRDLSGGLLIALGVVVELAFSSLSSRTRDRIRARQVERIAELTIKAEEERRERIRLERFVAGRDLTQSQVEILRARLSGLCCSDAKVALSVNTEEAKRFGGYLCTGLRDCGWSISICADPPSERFPMPGLIVLATPGAASQTAAETLTAAMAEIGVTCLMISGDGVESGERYWPPGLYMRDASSVLIVVNEPQLLEA